MFSDKKPFFYVTPKDGKMEVYRGKNEDGTKKVDQHDYVTGRVVEIVKSEYVYKDETISQWKVKIVDGDDTAIISVNYSSGFTRGFMNCLANADLSKPIKFGCYVSNKYNCPSIIQNNEIVKWKYDSSEVPKTEKVKVGSKEVLNDEKVVAWITKIVAEIVTKIPVVPASVEQVAEAVGGEVMHEESTPDYATDLPFP